MFLFRSFEYFFSLCQRIIATSKAIFTFSTYNSKRWNAILSKKMFYNGENYIQKRVNTIQTISLKDDSFCRQNWKIL